MLSTLVSNETCIRMDADTAKRLRGEGRGVYLLPLGFDWEVLGAIHPSTSSIWAGLLFGHDECRAVSVSSLMTALCADQAPSDPHIEVPFLSIERRSSVWNAEIDPVYRVRPPVSVGDRLWISEPFAPAAQRFDASGSLQIVEPCGRGDSRMHLRITGVDLEPNAGWPLVSTITAERPSSMCFSFCASIFFDVILGNIDHSVSGDAA